MLSLPLRQTQDGPVWGEQLGLYISQNWGAQAREVHGPQLKALDDLRKHVRVAGEATHGPWARIVAGLQHEFATMSNDTSEEAQAATVRLVS